MDSPETVKYQAGEKIMPLVIVFFSIFFLHLIQCEARYCVVANDTHHLSIQKDNILGNPVNVWIASDQTPVYHCYESTDQPKDYLTIGKRFFVVCSNYKVIHNRQQWSLLTASHTQNVNKTTIMGWVLHDYLLDRFIPLKDPKTGLLQKVLIKEGDAHQGDVLNVYKSHKAQKCERFVNTRTVFYVYDFFPKKSLLAVNSELLLIGVEPHLDVLTSSALLTGWIPRSKVTFWTTRTACEFPPGVTVRLTSDTDKTDYSNRKVTERLFYNELRNPILKKEKDHYVIGLFCRLPAEKLLFQRKVQQIQTGLEVLFVMDGSRSMTPVFKGVVEGIEQISSKLSEQCKNHNMQQPRFALMIYRDQKTRNQSMKIVNNRTVPANLDYCQQETTFYQMGNITRFLNTLSQQIACDSDTSYTESVYMGLISGIQKCNFQHGTKSKLPKRLRVVIHMGDEGDNGSGKFTSEDVLKTFKQYHIFKYFAVDVSSASKAGRFKESVYPVIQQCKKGLFVDGNGEIDQIILDHLYAIHQNAIDLNYQLNIIAKGFAGKNPGMSGVVSKEILEYAKKVIQANNIQLNMSENYHQYVEGKYSKDLPIDIRILASMTDIEKMTRFLSELLAAKDNLKRRNDIWEHSLKIIIGDEACEENGMEISLEECNEKRNGIPVKTSFMTYTKSQFLNLSGAELQKVYCEARIALEQFRAFLKNKFIQSITIDSYYPCVFKPKFCMDLNGDGEVIHESQASLNKAIDKYFFREGGESMAWLPLNHFQINNN